VPWSISEREGRYCVVKDDDGEVEGCHETREKALAQQRALYANEPGMRASLELDTEALMEEFFPEPDPPAPIQVQVEAVAPDFLPALVGALEALSERLIASEERQERIVNVLENLASAAAADRETLIATIRTLVDTEPPFVKVDVPQGPAPLVTVETPRPQRTVRTVKVERDPFGVMIGATVEEVADGNG
jgi:hypothetical protein